jgi:hypothetical protein
MASGIGFPLVLDTTPCKLIASALAEKAATKIKYNKILSISPPE